MDIDLKQIRELMRAMKQMDVSELEIEGQEQRIFLRRGGDAPTQVVTAAPLMHAGPATLPPPPPAAPVPSAAPPPAPAAPAEDPADVAYITSPFVGTFYRAPSPDAAPFTDVGARISKGTVLCIVEAMKLMNEIESEISGEIVEILVENGKPVEFGDKLFKVKQG